MTTRKPRLVYDIEPEQWAWVKSLSAESGLRVGEVVNYVLKFAREYGIRWPKTPPLSSTINGLKIEESDNVPCSAASDSEQAKRYGLLPFKTGDKINMPFTYDKPVAVRVENGVVNSDLTHMRPKVDFSYRGENGIVDPETGRVANEDLGKIPVGWVACWHKFEGEGNYCRMPKGHEGDCIPTYPEEKRCP